MTVISLTCSVALLSLLSVGTVLAADGGGHDPLAESVRAASDRFKDVAVAVSEGYGLGPFYELHVWAWKQNPHGAFADMNPAVSCEHASMK